MKKILGYLITCLCVLSLTTNCTKENYNQRKAAGVWKFEKITTVEYSNNTEVSQKDTVIDAVMQIMNTDAIDNNVYFEGFEPFGVSFCHWDIAYKKPKVIDFYLLDLDQGANFSILFNIEKLNSRKMVLSYFQSDNDLNIQTKTIWTLKKER